MTYEDKGGDQYQCSICIIKVKGYKVLAGHHYNSLSGEDILSSLIVLLLESITCFYLTVGLG